MTTTMIEVTDAAFDNARRFKAREKAAESAFLRLGVKGGGCSGFAYVIQFDERERPGDVVVREGDGFKVVVDPRSLEHLQGMVLDFSGGLNGKGFEFKNPNAKSTCGCGKS